jgi:pimeloyl-ACP methyl ester carboxylesterase
MLPVKPRYHETCMAKPTPRTTVKPATQQKQPVEIVDPRWLFKMFGIALTAALVCGYLTVAGLFYYSSWQLVLHPTRNAGGGTALPTQRVQFDADAGGNPRLSGEWYPAEAGSPRANQAVLYLRGADGQLDPADGTQIATLHGLGLNVFAFDYSGYGTSTQHPHPSEKQMMQDAAGAYAYLARTYNFREPGKIILFGSGVGVSIAAQLAQIYPRTAGLIGYNADPEVLDRVRLDRRSKLFPLILFHDRFTLDSLKTLKTPKLLYTVGPDTKTRAEVYRTAADPKLTVEVPTHASAEERAAVARFLDDYFPAAPAQLSPH